MPDDDLSTRPMILPGNIGGIRNYHRSVCGVAASIDQQTRFGELRLLERDRARDQAPPADVWMSV